MYANNEFALMKDKVTCRMGVNMDNEKTQKHEQVNEPISDGASEDKRSKHTEHSESSESVHEDVSQQEQSAIERNSSDAEHTEVEHDGADHEQQAQDHNQALPQLHVEAPDIALLDTALLQGVAFQSPRSFDNERDSEASDDTEEESPASHIQDSAQSDSLEPDSDAADQNQAAQLESQDVQNDQVESSSSSEQDDNNPAVSSAAERIFGNLHTSDALSKRKAVLRRIVSPIFAVIAVLSIIGAVLSLIVWRVNPQVDIATTSMNTAYAVTDAGLLDTTDGPVTITARTNAKASKTSSSSSSSTSAPQICIALTSSSDALGWLEGTAYTRISGFNSWQEFSTTAHKAQGKVAQGNATFTNSDMWQQVRCGAGKVNLTWQKQHDQDAVVVVHVLDEQESAQLAKEQQQKGDAATQSDQSADQTANTEKSKSDASANSSADAQMTVSMQWTRSSTPNYATPLWVIAAIALVLAILCATLFVIWPKPHVPRVGRHGHGARTRHSTVHRHGAKAADSASTAGATNAVVVGANDASEGSEGKAHADATQDGELTEVLPVVDELPPVSSTDLQEYFARLMQEKNASASAENEQSDKADKNETPDDIEVADGDNTTEHTEEEEAQEDKNQEEGADHE